MLEVPVNLRISLRTESIRKAVYIVGNAIVWLRSPRGAGVIDVFEASEEASRWQGPVPRESRLDSESGRKSDI